MHGDPHVTAAKRRPPWHELRRLPNGREVLIRPVHPADADPLRAAFPLLQPEEVQQRFMCSMKEMVPSMARRLTRIDPRSEFALVAAEPLPPGEALVGAVARIALDPGGRRGEFAILVSHYLAHMGLGRHLMTRLVKWSRRRGLDALYGDVLETNGPMLRLADALGFARRAGGRGGAGAGGAGTRGPACRRGATGGLVRVFGLGRAGRWNAARLSAQEPAAAPAGSRVRAPARTRSIGRWIRGWIASMPARWTADGSRSRARATLSASGRCGWTSRPR
ncbi:GNAT family N-acetyltransferase [Lysobacter sp. N42]|nr:GNAT family N-acetyltransferase [Lysobacter sp. N42]